MNDTVMIILPMVGVLLYFLLDKTKELKRLEQKIDKLTEMIKDMKQTNQK
ncbi:hypothetical protein SAMN04488134_11515 [Amphibacillus marinus]|uniref:Uncharacterized protein n=1 Tax=Amphibacillus marinus TaxID=872970 RepID=A0A1H8T7D3_9BACI|nr:hypothetical protein [Amphibacillus marinus]SEO87059.1 hypothetical protein SAMN04488134_11515 [Amphibacillus marinus]